MLRAAKLSIPVVAFVVITVLAIIVPYRIWDGYEAIAVSNIVSGAALALINLWGYYAAPSLAESMGRTIDPASRTAQTGFMTGLGAMGVSRIITGMLHFMQVDSSVEYLGASVAIGVSPLIGVAVYLIARQRAKLPAMPRSLKTMLAGLAALGLAMIGWSVYSELSLAWYGGILCMTCPVMFLPVAILFMLAGIFYLNESSKRGTSSQGGGQHV